HRGWQDGRPGRDQSAGKRAAIKNRIAIGRASRRGVSVSAVRFATCVMQIRMTYFRMAALVGLLAVVVASGCEQQTDRGPMADMHAAMEIRTAFGGSSTAAAASTEGTAAAATGTGWATIKGRFVFDGTPPKMPPYNVTKDQATCAP